MVSRLALRGGARGLPARVGRAAELRAPRAVLLFLGAAFGYLLPSGVRARLLVPFRDPAELARLGTAEWLGGTALSLGLACAAVYAVAAVALGSHPALAGAARRARDAARRRLRRGLPHRPASPPERSAGLRRPPSTRAVGLRELALVGRRAAWPLVLALLFAWVAARAETAADGTRPPFADLGGGSGYGLFVLVSLGWPVFVWIDERRVLSEQDEALPVDATKRRVLHAGAGAFWLLAATLLVVAGKLGGAAAAGTIASPSDVPSWLWPGVPFSVLTLYLFGTVAAILLEGPVLTVIVSCMAAVFGSYAWGDGPLSPRRVLSAFWLDDPGSWSYPAALTWLAVCAAAATAAIALSAWADRHRRFPTLADARGWLRSWARAQPGSPLRGHAGR